MKIVKMEKPAFVQLQIHRITITSRVSKINIIRTKSEDNLKVKIYKMELKHLTQIKTFSLELLLILITSF